MIIKRQKLYTRQDQKVIREIIKETNGLRSLPKGVKGLTTRDALRLEQLSQDIRKGKITDVEEFKTLATHLGLPETAKGGQHLVEKYNNPELLKRYKNIKAYKEGVREEYKRLSDLTEKESEMRKKAWKSRDNLENKRVKKGQVGKESSYKTREEKEFQNWINENGEERNELIDKIEPRTKKSEIPEERLKEQKELQEKNRLDYRAKTELSEDEKDLAERLKQNARRNGIKVVKSNDGRSRIKMDRNGGKKRGTRVIELGEDTPWIVAHEHGHAKFSRRLNKGHRGSMEATAKRYGPLFHLSNEHGANVEGAQLIKNELRRQGKSQEEIKEVLEKYWNNQEKSYMTYYNSNRDGSLGIYKRYLNKTNLVNSGRSRRKGNK